MTAESVFSATLSCITGGSESFTSSEISGTTAICSLSNPCFLFCNTLVCKPTALFLTATLFTLTESTGISMESTGINDRNFAQQCFIYRYASAIRPAPQQQHTRSNHSGNYKDARLQTIFRYELLHHLPGMEKLRG